jgi:hypothetical protein
LCSSLVPAPPCQDARDDVGSFAQWVQLPRELEPRNGALRVRSTIPRRTLDLERRQRR